MNRIWVGIVTLCASGGVSLGVLNPVGPFVGQVREPLNFSNTNISADQPIFGGAGHLISHNGQTLIHLLLGDTLSGDTVSPHTGMYILGWTEGPGIFTFSPPVQMFGAYWNNNSGANDATVQFFDAGNSLIGTQTATIPAPGNTWVWNGWASSTPISRISVLGNGVLNGFLWTDDLEASYVPGPGALALAVLGSPLLMRRQRTARM